jgi:peptide/nickel transport system substrate-binding protein
MKLLLSLMALATATLSAGTTPNWGGELRVAIASDPKTFNPLLVTEQSANLVRYLTGGALIRWNHASQAMEPELACAWRISPDGRELRFGLREDARFSDGSPVTAADVVFTFRQLLNPKINSVDAQALLAGGQVTLEAAGARTVVFRFPRPVAGVERQIGAIAITSARSLAAAGDPVRMATAGPFHVAAYTPGATITLGRNPYYWKTAGGRRLPYLDAIRLEIRPDRSLEVNSLLRGELDLSSSVEPKAFSRLAKASGVTAVDAGPSLDAEQLWFNQNPAAPLSEYKKEWFRSREFRLAVSSAIHRDDLARLVFDSHATPASGIMPASNRMWANNVVHPPAFDVVAARKLLSAAGFSLANGVLHDAGGRAVEFSVITNAGSDTRTRMVTMIADDLAKVGIRVRLVTLDFPSLIERITRTFDYDACLLGMVNDDPDPNSLMAVWMSSGPNHPWFPAEKTPATPWEAEIDRLMLAQNREPDRTRRKNDFDRVQQIVAEQAPVIFLVVKNSLAAYGSRVANAAPSPFFPYLLWNADRLWIQGERQ